MSLGILHIGWSKVNITPPRKTLLQGQFHARLARGTISPLTATALAVETRGPGPHQEQAVFLSCDLTAAHFKSELIAKLQGQCPDLDLTKITLNTTHTHNSPPTSRGAYVEPENDPDFMNPDDYRRWLIDQLAGAVISAWRGRQPGSISRGFGYAVVGRCRRAVYADGSARMYGSTNQPDFQGLEACDNHAVNMLFTHDAAGTLSGMIVNLACPSQCDENGEDLSSDYWHEVREGLARRFGSSVHLLPQCAPAGDVSPHLMLDQTEEKDLRDRMQMNDKQIIARRILAALDEGYQFASPRQSEVVFTHQVKTFQLPRLMVTPEQYAMEKCIPTLTEDQRKRQPWGFERLWPFGPVCDIVTRYEQQDAQPFHAVECHLIRLGDVVFATNPFELYVDYGTRIRARSKALQTFLIQLGDGAGNGFYLPTRRAFAGGHYSALIKSNWVGPEGGQLLVDETVAGIAELFPTEQYPRTR
jgi:hypothetical protein